TRERRMGIKNPASFMTTRWTLGLLGLVLVATSCSGTIDAQRQHPISEAAIGTLTSMGNGATRTFYRYDALGRVRQTQHVLDDGKRYIATSEYGYPRPGAAGPGSVLTAQTFPHQQDGAVEVVAYEYDLEGAQQRITTQQAGQAEEAVVKRILR